MSLNGTAASLRPFVPSTLLEWLHQRPEQRWQLISGSLIFSDVSGFTALSERLSRLGKRGAEELNALLNIVIGAMVADCEAESGDVLVFGGDAIVVLFVGERHAERAARAAHAIRRTVTGRHRTESGVIATLKVSTGVHSGEIMMLRTRPGFEKLVIVGPAVSDLCRAEGAASAGQVLLSEGAVPALHERLLGEPVGAARLLKRKPPAASVPHVRSGEGEIEVDADVLLDCVPPGQRELHATTTIGEHRQVAVAFIQFSGADELLTRDGPAALTSAINELSVEVARVAAENGTHVLDMDVAIDGGKYYLAAGAPISLELDEERLLRTVVGLVRHRSPLRISAGVNRGRVFAGVLGGASRRCYTCLGDTVNLAARLCAKADAAQVVAPNDYLDHVAPDTEATRCRRSWSRARRHPSKRHWSKTSTLERSLRTRLTRSRRRR